MEMKMILEEEFRPLHGSNMTKKDCFDFCSEAFGEMRHSTEEEKELYEKMLDKISIPIAEPIECLKRIGTSL